MKTIGSLVWLWLGIWAVTGCDNKTTVVDACGDGVVDPGEECDSNVGDQSCASLGYYNVTGVLCCTRDCQWDVDSCGGRCGDNAVDAADGEQCDGDNLNGQSCQTQGYAGGNLACDDGCRFVVTGCTSVCGNGLREVGEACDDGNDDSDDGCAADCTIETGWTCDEGTPNVCAPVCGDLAAHGPEACDGADLRGQNCEGLGYHGGTLACAEDCTFDVSGCAAVGRCGDGAIQATFMEECDGAELAGQTCEGLGYYGGALACDVECLYDVSACAEVGRCGDGLLHDGFGELCDGSAFGGVSCTSLGFYGGQLMCSPDCASYDYTSCMQAGWCGDGIRQAQHERCDGADLGGESCVSLGYHGGQLVCGEDCETLFEDDCVAVGICGDGIIQAAFSEECDLNEFGAETCQSRGYYEGTLVCQDCRVFTTNCQGRCGDSVLQTLHEDCEPTLADPDWTCDNLFGLWFGEPECSSDCAHEQGTCSNGLVFAATTSASWVRVSDLEVDAAGNFYFVGSFIGTLFGETALLQKAFILKLNPDGTLAWIRTRSGVGGGLAQANALQLTASKFYVVGWAVEGASPDAFLWSMNDDGSGQSYSSWGSSGDDAGQDLVVLPSGGDFQVWVTGYASGAVGGVGGYGGRDIFLSRFDPGMTTPAETRVWGTNSDDQGSGVGFHETTNSIVIVGTSSGNLNGLTNLGGSDQFLIRHMTDGSQTNFLLFGSNQPDTSSRLALDGEGSVYVAGAQDLAGMQNISLTKLDPVGPSVTWRWVWGGAAAGTGTDVIVGTDGKVRVVGTVQGALLGQPAVGGADGFVITCNNDNCSMSSARVFGSSGQDQVSSVVQMTTGHVFVAGTTTGALDGVYGGPDLAGFLYRVQP